MRYIVPILISILLGGCSSKEVMLRTYTLNPNIDISRVSNSIYKSKSLKIAYPTSIRGVVTKRIAYSYSDIEDGTYINARWSRASGKLLMSSYIKALEGSRVFGDILEYTSLADSEYLLESEVYEFYHKIRGDVSLSVVSVKFNLVDMSSNRLIKTHKFTYQIPTPTLDAQGYVEATNIAVGKMCRDMVVWLGEL
jgi:ABC-type uncharacterized transport system auxiliary subunit